MINLFPFSGYRVLEQHRQGNRSSKGIICLLLSFTQLKFVFCFFLTPYLPLLLSVFWNNESTLLQEKSSSAYNLDSQSFTRFTHCCSVVFTLHFPRLKIVSQICINTICHQYLWVTLFHFNVTASRKSRSQQAPNIEYTYVDPFLHQAWSRTLSSILMFIKISVVGSLSVA